MTNDEVEQVYQTDTFEDKVQKLIPNMSDADLIRSAEQVEYMCKCATCPSYQETREKKVVFCTLGKNVIANENKGCLCGECPMTKMMSLRWNYYCTQGNGMELSRTEKAKNTIIPILEN